VVARCGGEEFALLLSDTTLAKSLPLAERLRQAIETAQFSYGSSSLRVSASLGISQFVRGEEGGDTEERARLALKQAKVNGGNTAYWHDGREIHPVHAVHLKSAEDFTAKPSSFAGPIATPIDPNAANRKSDEDGVVFPREGSATKRASISGRSLFINNLKQQIDEWYGGGLAVSVILMRIDQYSDLVQRFGTPASDFVKSVVGRMLEASSRSMDERCQYDDETFALLVIGCDGLTAKRIAKRLRSQVGECKLRLDEEIWELSATIGAAQCREGESAMDLLLQAEQALAQATKLGGNMLCMNESA
jgi:diguanylate cyclase (GGDEF)-like protein